MSPGPVGTRIVCESFPSASDHTRTVLSSEPVTAKRPAASTPAHLIGAVCNRDRQPAPAARKAAPSPQGSRERKTKAQATERATALLSCLDLGKCRPSRGLQLGLNRSAR